MNPNTKKRRKLEEYVAELAKSRGNRFYAVMEAYHNITKGKVKLEDPHPPNSFREYITRLDYTIAYWSTVIFVLLTLVTIYLSEHNLIFEYLRYILGSIYIIFLPGLATIELLYGTSKDLSPLEKLALSVAISISLSVMFGLILNSMGFGLQTYTIALFIAGYTISVMTLCIYRRYKSNKNF